VLWATCRSARRDAASAGRPSVSAPFVYLLFALLAIVGPGIAIQRLLRLSVDRALVIPIGLVLTAGAYGVGLSFGVPVLLPLLALGLDLSLIWSLRGASLARGPRLSGVIGPVLLMICALAVTEYPLNRRGGSGDFLLDPVLPEDAAFHAGLTWELAQGYPPEVPGFSGRVMTYHFGLPLVRAAACRFFGILPYDSLTRFDNTLGVVGLALVLPGLVAALGGGSGAVALAPWFLLATDLSFLFALRRGLPFWITATKGSDILLSLLQSNAVVPALTLALAALIALKRHDEGEGTGWLVLAAGLGLGAAAFKVFVASQLLLGLLWAGLVARHKRAILVMGIPLALALGAVALGSGGRDERVLFDPLVVLRDVRQNLGLGLSSEAPPWTFVGLWLVFSLGLRLVGLPEAVRSLASRDGARLAMAGMALSGWPLGLLFRISPFESPDKPQNEALYFFEQSGLLLWVFVALALGRARAGGARGILLGVGCVALALPSTVQFVLAKAGLPPGRVPGEVVEAMSALEGASHPGDVILERPRLERFPPPPIVFIGRRVPFASYFPFLSQWVPRAVLDDRRRSVQRFFETEDREEALRLARALGARGLCLYGSDAVRFETKGLTEIFRGEIARVYALP
jgi:hypothetical protein